MTRVLVLQMQCSRGHYNFLVTFSPDSRDFLPYSGKCRQLATGTFPMDAHPKCDGDIVSWIISKGEIVD